MESPPKRVTRARAAAKPDTNSNSIRVATAAPKARATRVTATTKRKTRAEDDKDEDELQKEPESVIEPEPAAPKTTRAKAKKPVQEEDEEMMDAPPVRSLRGKSITVESERVDVPKATRGRPKTIIIDTPGELAKSTRGRPKKVDGPAQATAATNEEPKRATRSRATITATAKPAAPKKTVKFEEPDKENVIPVTTAKGKAKEVETTTGLRAKPVRKPPVPRATRGRPKAEEKKTEATPLSPKKITQVGSVGKESQSEDELATTEKTPMKPLSRSPIKPPGSIFNNVKRLDFANSTTITVNRATTQDFGASISSPARRPAQSPFKDSVRTSPHKTVPQSSLQSPFKPSLAAPTNATHSSFKTSLMGSPARRPAPSPIKSNESASPSRGNKTSLFDSTPKATNFRMSKFATPRTLYLKNVSRSDKMMLPPSAPPKFSTGSPKASLQDDDATMMVEPKLKFTGRLSSIMPRTIDPAFRSTATLVEESNTFENDENTHMELDNHVVPSKEDLDTSVGDTEPSTPIVHASNSFESRLRDESPFDDSDSEDELTSDAQEYLVAPSSAIRVSSRDFATTPVNFQSISTPKPAQSSRMSLGPQAYNESKLGFTPLAAQLDSWMTASPVKTPVEVEESTSPTTLIPANELVTPQPDPSPAKSQYFEEQMIVLEEMADAPEQEEIMPIDISQGFDPIDLDEEDFALAEEADEMSMLDIDQLNIPGCDEDMFAVPAVDAALDSEGFALPSSATEDLEIVEDIQALVNGEELDGQYNDAFGENRSIPRTPEPRGLITIENTPYLQQSFEQALSEASQEYGDENDVPNGASFAVPPAVPNAPHYNTPKQILRERTFHTVSKVPLKPAADDTPLRPSPVKRSASSSKIPSQRPTSNLGRKNTVISYSPEKITPRAKTPTREVANTPSTEWSNFATPARTPRRDLNDQLLKGAVVFVDVHTTEGADASVLFTELLTQMGARCVKTWNWNTNDEGSKIGITHVVFKDGGKRTMERVKAANGVVSCVGVGWVLDCERENQWLPESPYSVDTGVIPRGGNRRRKSMEPKALANMNGTLVASDTPSRVSSYTFPANTPLTSKSRRRDSVQWVRSSPASSVSPDAVPDVEEDFLSPIPATPQTMYAEEGLDGFETPGAQTPYFLKQGQLVQQTAPAKRFVESDAEEPGSDWNLSAKKDETVMARLMLARRKSLQWAPKVGSPLAR